MSRALADLVHAVVDSPPRSGWARNGARTVTAFVVIEHGNAMYPKAPLFYEVVFFGQAANGLLEAIEKGTFKKGTQFSCKARVERVFTFKSKRTGETQICTRVHVVEHELTHWWEGAAATKREDEGPEDE